MTEMTLDRPRHTAAADLPYHHRFQATESRIPEKPQAAQCPHCQTALAGKPEPHAIQRLRFSLVQLLGAAFSIVLSVLRLARLVVGMAFCLVGLVGFGLQNIAQKVVHPNDLRLLPLPGRRVKP